MFFQRILNVFNLFPLGDKKRFALHDLPKTKMKTKISMIQKREQELANRYMGYILNKFKLVPK